MNVETLVGLYNNITENIENIALESNKCIEDLNEIVEDMGKTENVFTNDLLTYSESYKKSVEEMDDVFNANIDSISLSFFEPDYITLESKLTNLLNTAKEYLSKNCATIGNILSNLNLDTGDIPVDFPTFELNVPSAPDISLPDIPSIDMIYPDVISLPDKVEVSVDTKDVVLAENFNFDFGNVLDVILSDLDKAIQFIDLPEILPEFSPPSLDEVNEFLSELENYISPEDVSLSLDSDLTKIFMNLETSIGYSLSKEILGDNISNPEKHLLYLKFLELRFQNMDKRGIHTVVSIDKGAILRDLINIISEYEKQKFKLHDLYIEYLKNSSHSILKNELLEAVANRIVPNIAFSLNRFVSEYSKLNDFINTKLSIIRRTYDLIKVKSRNEINKALTVLNNLKLVFLSIKSQLDKSILDIKQENMQMIATTLIPKFKEILSQAFMLKVKLSSLMNNYNSLDVKLAILKSGIIKAQWGLASLQTKFEILKYKDILTHAESSQISKYVPIIEHEYAIQSFQNLTSIYENYLNYLNSYISKLEDHPAVEAYKTLFRNIENSFRQWMEYTSLYHGVNSVVYKLNQGKIEGNASQYKYFFNWVKTDFSMLLEYIDRWFRSSVDRDVMKEKIRALYYGENTRSILNQAHTTISLSNKIVEVE